MTVYHKNSSSFILTGFGVLGGKKKNTEAERVAQNAVEGKNLFITYSSNLLKH